MHKLCITIQQPDIPDYDREYPRIPCNSERKKALFKLMTSPTLIHVALTVAEETGSSPAVVYAQRIDAEVEKGDLPPLTRHEKNFVGTVTAVVMVANGWNKTGKKQRFTHGLLKSAELYCRSQASKVRNSE